MKEKTITKRKTKKISKTKIERAMKKKTNPLLRNLILKLKKKQGDWVYLAYLLAKPTKKRAEVNLNKINKLSKEKEIVIVPGKILGKGSIDHKITISSLSSSKEAEKKLKNAGCEIKTIQELADKNTKFKVII